MRWRPLLKPLLDRTVPRVTRWYLRKPRTYKSEGLTLRVEPGVFHPGLYLSTRFMVDTLKQRQLKGKRMLELGSGSGMLSIWAARAGAWVTAAEISPLAVTATEENAQRNGVRLEVFHSDLFEGLPDKLYDLVVINPPYYPGNPKTAEEHAWYCGEGHDYFVRLFARLHEFCAQGVEVLMVLSEDCDLDKISGLARNRGWEMSVVRSRKKWGEWNYIYSLKYKRIG